MCLPKIPDIPEPIKQVYTPPEPSAEQLKLPRQRENAQAAKRRGTSSLRLPRTSAGGSATTGLNTPG